MIVSAQREVPLQRLQFDLEILRAFANYNHIDSDCVIIDSFLKIQYSYSLKVVLYVFFGLPIPVQGYFRQQLEDNLIPLIIHCHFCYQLLTNYQISSSIFAKLRANIKLIRNLLRFKIY